MSTDRLTSKKSFYPRVYIKKAYLFYIDKLVDSVISIVLQANDFSFFLFARSFARGLPVACQNNLYLYTYIYIYIYKHKHYPLYLPYPQRPTVVLLFTPPLHSVFHLNYLLHPVNSIWPNRTCCRFPMAQSFIVVVFQ